MLHEHGIFNPMSKFKKNKNKIKDITGHGFWACLTITCVRHGGHDRSKTQKKKKRKKKKEGNLKILTFGQPLTVYLA